jgi:Zn finger protein HypA/HybF involved in hydrogenase expression
VTCEACHREATDQKPPSDCIGCHRADDEHQGRFGEQCADCHQQTDWDRVRFDHDRKTDYPLRGQHQQQPCLACHKGTLGKESLPADCIGCHRGVDVHEGQQGEQCQRCHQESGWGDGIAFDHDLTKFPLIGLHAGTPCEECHLSARFQDAPGQCVDCHRDDDPHKQSLGTECALCHNPNAWTLWRFDHNRQTDFQLDGAHENLVCEGCHRTPLSRHARVASDCHGCHQQDDVHRGGFGRRCDRCHNTESFSDVRLAQ